MALKRGPSRFWAMLHRLGLAHAEMPFWRVVVEARLVRATKRWPERFDRAVTAVFVWARSIEEAEGIAALALEGEALEAVTADAKKAPPAAGPKAEPCAVARSELRFLPLIEGDARSEPPPRRRGARA